MMKLNGKEYSKEGLQRFCGNINQVAGITAAELIGGKAAGTKAYAVKTGGGLEYTLLPDKCLDISSVSFKGTNISFLAKPGIVSPQYAYPCGNEFLHYMTGGMLFTCGLKNVGGACETDGEAHPIHGRIGVTPAENNYGRSYWKNDEYILEAYGEMKDAALFGSNLVLKRKITSKLGENAIYISDELENNTPYEEEFMLLYHFNFGFPFLDEDTEIVFPLNSVVARDDEAEKGLSDSEAISAPIDSYNEQVFFRDADMDENGKVKVELLNKRLGIKVALEYDKENLPNLVHWKSMKSTDYALGIEPSNCLVFGREKEKENGTIKKIKPFSTLKFNLKLEFSVL